MLQFTANFSPLLPKNGHVNLLRLYAISATTLASSLLAATAGTVAQMAKGHLGGPR